MRFDFDFNRDLSVITAAFKNRRVCLETTDKYLSLSVILLFTLAVYTLDVRKRTQQSNIEYAK